MNIADALKKFNRKERYWLIRNALGAGSDRIGERFRHQLGTTIGIDIPQDAWWSMDYHLDWLVGALALFQDEEIIGKAQSNPDGLVQGNQEDIDLVVAFGTTLILVEAKGDTSWSNAQLNSKVPRLEAILGKNHVNHSKLNDLSVYFVLMSPKRSDKLLRNGGLAWPDWMTDQRGQPLWLPMHMAEADEHPSFLKVTRCMESGSVSKDGIFWKADYNNPKEAKKNA